MKKIISLLLVLSFCITLFACDSNTKENSEDTSSDEWQYVLPTPVVNAEISLPFTSADTFNPYKAKSKLNRDLISIVYEALYSRTEDGYGYPQLALSATENGNVVTVKLKQGIVFSDGTPFNAENVKYSYDLAKNNSYYKNNLKYIESFDVVDNFTLKVTYSGAMLMPLNVLSFPIVLKSGNNYIGTGKYVLKYLEAMPYFEVNKRHEDFSNEWNAQIALYDMAGISNEIYTFKAKKISVYNDDLTDGAYENLSSKTVSLPTNNLVYAGLNMKWAGSITSVAWVRRVINIGINRVDIGASSFLGQTEPTTTPFKPSFYRLSGQELIESAGDLNRAINLLEENGYDSFTSDGYRTDGVNTLKLSILVCNDNPYKVGVAEALKKSLQTLGIKASVNAKKRADYLKALKSEHYEIYIGEIELPADGDLTEFFSESGSVNYGISTKSFIPYENFKDGKLNMTEFIENFYTSVPFVPLFYRKNVLSVNPEISGIDSTESDAYASVNEWHVAKPVTDDSEID
ncbi:MAG: hypothetical protein IKC01_06105 [Clostridia bacterium]|nr:hypothetical protein [Clostridia bacterium]